MGQVEAIVDSFAKGRVDLEARVQRYVLADFQQVSNWSSPQQVAAVTKLVAQRLNAGQMGIAQMTDAYLQRVTSFTVGKSVVGGLVPAVMGQTLRKGVADHEQVYARVAAEYRRQRSLGLSDGDALGLAFTRAQAMVSTDLGLAFQHQTQRFMDRNRINYYRRVIRPEMSRTGSCALCAAAADRIYRKQNLLPIHAHCITGDTVIAAEKVSAVTRRLHTGLFVLLNTASGHQLTVTPNHPVLTTLGWVPAGFLNEGDEIVRGIDDERVVLGGPDEQHGPATAEQVWRALTVQHGLRSRRVPLAAEDFHGDGSDGEVDVVLVDGLLPDVGHVSFVEPAGHGGLVDGWGAGLGFLAEGNSAQLSVASLATSGGLVGAGGDPASFFGAGRGVAQGGGLGSRGRGLPSLAQCAEHGGSGATQLLRDRLDGQALVDEPYDLGGGDLGPLEAVPVARFDPASVEYSEQGRGVYAELGSRLLERLSGQVQIDGLVGKEFVSGSRHVYNLHTAEGWYSAGSHIVSNCKCTVICVTAKSDPGSQLNNDTLQQLYDQAGSTYGQDLKKVRVKVFEHPELGPQLRVAGQNFRDLSEAA